MNKNTISGKISIFFALFLLLISILAAIVFWITDRHREMEFVGRVKHNMEFLDKKPLQNERIKISEIEVEILSKEETSRLTADNTPSIHKAPPHPPPQMRDNRHPHVTPPDEMRLRLYKTFFENAIVINKDGEEIGVADGKSKAVFYFYFLSLLGGVLLAITLLYAAIIKSLRPLKELEKEIEAFGVGVKPIQKPRYADNEIGKIQKAFYEVSSKISGLIEAREIFLKNAAHELKTPIAKGVIVAHMIDGEKHQKRLLEIFSSMTQIVEGLMTVEGITARGFEPKIEPLLLRSFCEKIRKKLLFDASELTLEIEHTAIAMADSRLLEIALSNLFENSVKFKKEGSVAVCSFDEGKLSVKNLGDELERPIERYFEPFFKETSLRNQDGTGLGLYLAKKAVEIQGLRLSYRYEDGFNIFQIG